MKIYRDVTGLQEANCIMQNVQVGNFGRGFRLTFEAT